MAEGSKKGTPWEDEELDAIVADYFAMLQAEIFGRTYVKSHHSQRLMARIERTHRSVEFKHQNISAVLDEMGLPWIPGYKPKSNYQNAIFDAIDRFLSTSPDILTQVPPVTLVETAVTPTTAFVAAPSVKRRSSAMPDRLRRLVQKFDPVERDLRNRSLGKAGEEFVMDIERRRLTTADRSDLARRIRWVAMEDGDGAGYDVLSFNDSGRECLIEVKTTNGSARTPFFLTRNECSLATERPADWCIYRVHMFATEPRIFAIQPPLEESLTLRAEVWRASF
jgi:hypothetical protein